MYRTHTCGELRISDAGKQVTLSGWVQRVRDLGGMTFLDLRDRYGITQIVVNSDTQPELSEQVRQLGREDVVQVYVTVTETASKYSKIPTGDIAIALDKLVVLSESARPPFTIDDDPDGGDELRLQYPYLD